MGGLAGHAAAREKGQVEEDKHTHPGTGVAARLHQVHLLPQTRGPNINSLTHYDEKYPPVSLWGEIDKHQHRIKKY